MTWVIKWLTNFFFDKNDKIDDVEVSDYRFKLEEYENISIQNETQGLIKRSGVITFISDTYGLIDNSLYFEAKVGPKLRKLNIGEIVRYTSLKTDDYEAERIIQIDETDDVFEDETIDFQETKCLSSESNEATAHIPESMERVLNGKIALKQGDELFIQPLNIHCNLDNVQCDFIPIEGDWVSVVAEVSTDSDSHNFYGEILYLKKLRPLLVRNGRGTVTYLNDCQGKGFKGSIENEIYFSTDFCQLDFSISFGDQISYMAIESDQARYKWRAVSIRPTRETQAAELSTRIEELTKDKCNIVVEGNLKLNPLELGQTQEIKLIVKNNGIRSQILEKYKISSRVRRSQIEAVSSNETHEILIEPGKGIEVVLKCTANHLGLSSEVVVFYFKNFKIEKLIQMDVIYKDLSDFMHEKQNFEIDYRQKNKYYYKNFDLSGAIFGKKIMYKSRFKTRSRALSGQYVIPEKLFKIALGEECEDCTNIKDTLLEYASCLKGDLDQYNYKEKLHTLLYLEEIHSKISCRKYDLHGVIFRPKDKYFTLDISNMENSESFFTVGTVVIATQPWSEVNTWKQVGFIQDIRNDLLYINFHESFHSSYNETQCDVIFQPVRIPFLRCHTAIDVAAERLGLNWLFPKKLNEKPPMINIKSSGDSHRVKSSLLEHEVDESGYIVESSDSFNELTETEYNLKWFNPNLNDLQKEAVVNVLEGKCRPLPYVILGPPGTGKTSTIIEIAMQVFTMITDSRLLIGTPSNSAADIVCHYLISTGKFTPGELVRLLARSRAVTGNVPENIIPYCAAIYDEDLSDQTSNPHLLRMNNIDTVGTQRIVVSTCNTVGLLHQLGLDQGHFSHIIIDEAAQTNEPEALIPISFLDPKRGHVILCGDTEQLGPICLGFKYKEYDLSKSLLERITKLPPYHRDHTLFPHTRGFNPLCITRLCINYRSVPEILTLSSRLFYDSELVPTVSQETGPEAEIIRRFNFKTEKRDTPPAIIFHALRGQTFQEENSYSWFNPLEIWQCICYLKRLYSIGLSAEDVGIITPYRKQVEKIRMLLPALNLSMPKIGSVEEFQGGERYAIILTTVRSSLKFDDIHSKTLGFLASPRRVNVAISRARALLIIIGNPFTLKIDPYWSAVIQYCINNDSCSGSAFENAFAKQDA